MKLIDKNKKVHQLVEAYRTLQYDMKYIHDNIKEKMEIMDKNRIRYSNDYYITFDKVFVKYMKPNYDYDSQYLLEFDLDRVFEIYDEITNEYYEEYLLEKLLIENGGSVDVKIRIDRKWSRESNELLSETYLTKATRKSEKYIEYEYIEYWVNGPEVVLDDSYKKFNSKELEQLIKILVMKSEKN